MTIRGTAKLEDEGAWEAATGEYVAAHFDDAGDLGAWDVTVSIRVTNQTSGGEEDEGLFERRRRGLRGSPRDDDYDLDDFESPSVEDAKRRRLEASVEVAYDQISTKEPEDVSQRTAVEISSECRRMRVRAHVRCTRGFAL